MILLLNKRSDRFFHHCSVFTVVIRLTSCSCCRLFSSIFKKKRGGFYTRRNTTRLCDFHLQNHLLEVGWNKSEATQWDVEKTLDCCGFSSVNYNGSCAAVSKSPGIFFPFVVSAATWSWFARPCLWELLHFPPSLPLPLEMLREHPGVLWKLLRHHPAVRRGGATVCGWSRTLLQFYGGR